MEALKRVKANTVEKRLLDARGNPSFQLIFYAVNKKGEYAGVSMYAREGQQTERFAVCTEKGPELLACEPLPGGDARRVSERPPPAEPRLFRRCSPRASS